MAFYSLINFIRTKVNNINVSLKYLLLGAINKGFNKKKLYLITLIDFESKTLAI